MAWWVAGGVALGILSLFGGGGKGDTYREEISRLSSQMNDCKDKSEKLESQLRFTANQLNEIKVKMNASQQMNEELRRAMSDQKKKYEQQLSQFQSELKEIKANADLKAKMMEKLMEELNEKFRLQQIYYEAEIERQIQIQKTQKAVFEKELKIRDESELAYIKTIENQNTLLETMREARRNDQLEIKRLNELVLSLTNSVNQLQNGNSRRTEGANSIHSKEVSTMSSLSDSSKMTKSDFKFIQTIEEAAHQNSISREDCDFICQTYNMMKKLRKGAREVIELYLQIRSSGAFVHSCNLSCYLKAFFASARSGYRCDTFNGKCETHKTQISFQICPSSDPKYPIPSKMSIHN